jgi:hypothetical protein
MQFRHQIDMRHKKKVKAKEHKDELLQIINKQLKENR